MAQIKKDLPFLYILLKWGRKVKNIVFIRLFAFVAGWGRKYLKLLVFYPNCAVSKNRIVKAFLAYYPILSAHIGNGSVTKRYSVDGNIKNNQDLYLYKVREDDFKDK